MENKPSFRKYAKIVKETINALVFKHKIILVATVFCIITNFIAAWLTVKTTSQFSKISKAFQTPEFDSVLLGFLGISAITICFRYIPYMFYDYCMQNLQRESFCLNLRSIMGLDYVNFHRKTPGAHHYAISIRSYAAPMTCQVTLLDLVSIVATVLFGAFKVNSDIDPYYTAFFVVTPILYAMGMFIFIKKKMNYQYELLQKEQHSANKLTDKLLNYEAIKAYNLEERESRDFYNVVGQQTKANINMGRFEALARYFLSFTFNLPFIAMMTIFLFRKQGTDGGSSFLTLTLLFLELTGQLRRLGNDVDQLVEFLNQINFLTIEAADRSHKENRTLTFNDSIDFENVSILYKDRAVINNINISIKKGKKIGIVGVNGTGKSTLIKSILGFSEYTGNIRMDGTILKNVKSENVMAMISYVPQDDCTSDDTIIENLLLGLNETDKLNLTREQQIQKIKEIAERFNVHETFLALEDGYNSDAGSRGHKLSGGQRQKISLVRAVLKDAPIFIFDEATAAMDKKYEKETIRNILNNLREKTILMIVHGKDYLHLFDELIFLNEGVVAGFDSYANLLKNNEDFREVVN